MKITLLLALFLITPSLFLAQNAQQNELLSSSVPCITSDPAPKVSYAEVSSPIIGSRESSIAWCNDVQYNTWYTTDVDDMTITTIGSVSYLAYMGDFLPGDDSKMYAIDYNTNHLIEIAVATGISTTIATVTPPMSQAIFSGMATDKTTGTVYIVWTNGSMSAIGTINVATGDLAQIGSNSTVSPACIEIAIDGSGQMYGWDIATDMSYTIDKSTGVFTELGALGYDANYAQGGNWDPVNDAVYLAAYSSNEGAELRILNTSTGGTTSVGALPGETGAFAFPGTSGGGDPDIEVTPASITIQQTKTTKKKPASTGPIHMSNRLKEYIRDTVIDENGDIIYGVYTPGSPPNGRRTPVATPLRNAVMLPDVPAFNWSFGCGPTTGAMAAGYYDLHGFPDMYTGPTNGGVCPMDNSCWPDVDINGATLHQCPLSATRIDLDGRTTRGHVDDYWIEYDNLDPDPWITNGWTEHTWEDCTGDFLGTSQSTYSNSDGGSWYYYRNDGDPLYDFTGFEPDKIDACHGTREFYESRGYNVIMNYTQSLYGYNGVMNGFTLDDFRAEIDAGRPVVVLVVGHIMLGVGYEEDSDLIYIHDTWDYDVHSMTWGGEYSGMEHYAASVVELEGMSLPGDYFTINNVGEGSLSVTAIDEDASWLLTSGFPSTPFTVNPGESQNVSVSVDWGQLGDVQQTGMVTVSSNDPDEPSVTVSVTAVPNSLPDLTLQSHSINPSTVAAGGTVNTTCVVINQGEADAGSSLLKYYLSDDINWDDADVYLNFSDVPSLSAGNTSTQNNSLMIPSGTQTGSYYILFYADAEDAVAENNENNNVSIEQLTVSEPGNAISLDLEYDSVPSSAGFINVNVNANVHWDVVEDCDWITCNPVSGEGNGAFTVIYQNNNTNNMRSCAIIVSGGGASDGFVIYQEFNTSFEENTVTNKITVRPNPFTHSAIIEYELQQPEEVILKIYDYLGKQVYQMQLSQSRGKQQLIWHAENFADGMYYYSLQLGDVVAKGKMVKVR